LVLGLVLVVSPVSAYFQRFENYPVETGLMSLFIWKGLMIMGVLFLAGMNFDGF
jgi:hypothetical protein